VLLATSINRCLPPHADCKSAGGSSDLESLKSGKDRTKPWCALKKRNETDFHRELSRLPAFPKCRSRAFGTITLRRINSPNLHRPNCVCCCGTLT
jgi:hypothetical protein